MYPTSQERRQRRFQRLRKPFLFWAEKLEKEVDFKLYQTDMDRTLVMIKKVKSTPKKYPRKAGTPTKEPIL